MSADSRPAAQSSDQLDEHFAEYLETYGDEFLERINEDFEDSIVFVGRVLGGRPGAVDVEVTSIGRRGLDLVMFDDEGTHEAQLQFDEPVTGPAELTEALYGLLQRARATAGDDAATTSAEAELESLSSVRTFVAEVQTVTDVNPHLRRITIAGGALDSFRPCGPDSFFYLLLPPPGRDELTVDETFTWERFDSMPADDRPVGAYYTVRTWRPDVAELDLLCVTHGDSGPASAWVTRALPGQPVALWGPRTSYNPPPGTERLLLVADETGLPAASVIVEQRPPGMPVVLVAEVAERAERQDVPLDDDVELIWLHRDGAPAGTSTLLVDTVRSLEPPAHGTYVWGGAESRTMTAVRRYVRRELGVARESVSLVAYWRLT